MTCRFDSCQAHFYSCESTPLLINKSKTKDGPSTLEWRSSTGRTTCCQHSTTTISISRDSLTSQRRCPKPTCLERWRRSMLSTSDWWTTLMFSPGTSHLKALTAPSGSVIRRRQGQPTPPVHPTQSPVCSFVWRDRDDSQEGTCIWCP